MKSLRTWLVAGPLLLLAALAYSQLAPRRLTQPRKDRYAGLHYPKDPREFRGWRHHGDQIPVWEVHPELPKDVFTFARLRYPYRRNLRWQADYPEAELHLS